MKRMAAVFLLMLAGSGFSQIDPLDSIDTVCEWEMDEIVYNSGPFLPTGAYFHMTPDHDSRGLRPGHDAVLGNASLGLDVTHQPSLAAGAGPDGSGCLYFDGGADGGLDALISAAYTDAGQAPVSGIWYNLWNGFPEVRFDFWFRNDAIDNLNEYLLGAEGTWEVYASLEIPTAVVKFWLHGADGGTAVATYRNYALGQWHHVQGSWNGTEMTLLVDGVEAHDYTISFAPTESLKTSATRITAGARGLTSGFKGYLDQVRVWKRVVARDSLLAFKGAEGEGRWAVGGRGGDVYHVTTLANDGAGSLRYGLDSVDGPRTIVFDVAGNIHIDDYLRVDEPYVTIAGQTAPGDGVCIKGYGVLVKNTHDVVIQHMRFRPGDVTPGYSQDALSITGESAADSTYNVIVDHCSVSWGLDECLSPTKAVDNITVQWCLITECLDLLDHSRGSLIAIDHQDGWVTFHHNLWAHHHKRLPRIGTYNHFTVWGDLRNNVMYNWEDECSVGARRDDARVNLNYVGNYGVRGPSTEPENWLLQDYYLFTGENAEYMDIYQQGNRLDDNFNGVRDGQDRGWDMFYGQYDAKTVPFEMEPVTTHTADEAYRLVLDRAGAFWWDRDRADTKVIDDVENETGGLVISQDDIGGWPVLDPGTPRVDSDGDGMSDGWERANGHDPNTPNNNGDHNGDGYTDLEDYLYDLTIMPACDLNRNRSIDLGDLCVLAARWLDACDETNSFCDGVDINLTRRVAIDDLMLLTKYWGQDY